MNPLVTIVTPSYNQGRFIRATIESVLSQDYPLIEYIVMDAGSTDETEAVVKEYCGRLTWIAEKDRGQSHAINKGFRMAKGDIVAWLNSDDVILPGAVSHAVRAFERRPDARAVYGEGFEIDVHGNIKRRFPATEPFNLWKLVYHTDYVLQQTLYFRRSVFHEVGYLDESLHWTMDWDILVRIGKRYWLEYIPEYMGCIRQHEAAKTFTGGPKRFRELVRLLRRQCDLRFPPGYFIYGVDTYSGIWDEWLRRWTPGFLQKQSDKLRRFLHKKLISLSSHAYMDSQGWYSDGWATTKVHYMLPPGNGKLRLRGSLPNLSPKLRGQTIRLECNGTKHEVTLDFGEFDLTLPVSISTEPANIMLYATQSFIPAAEGLGTDQRRLAYMLRPLEWES